MRIVDALKGYQKVGAKLSLLSKSIWLHLAIFFVPFALVFGAIMAAAGGKIMALNTVAYHLAALINNYQIADPNRQLNYLTAAGEKVAFRVANYQEIPYLVSSTDAMHLRLVLAAGIAFLVGVIASFFGGRVLSGFHAGRTVKGSFIRGGSRVGVADFVKYLGSFALGKIRLGEVTLPKAKESTHIYVAGDSGVGKSHLLMDVLEVLRTSKRKAILLDKNGELFQHFYDPSVDKILAHFDDRSVNLTPLAEGVGLQDCERIATSFIPVKEGQGSGNAMHFIESSITVFSWLLYKMAKSAKTVLIDDIIRQLIMSTTEIETDLLGNQRVVKKRGVNTLLKGTLADLVVDTDSPEHASSVLGSIIPKIRALWYLRGLQDRELFSIREWLKKDEPGWLFIRVNEDHLESVNPLITAWMDTVVKGALSLPKSSEREIWCVIDELQSLEKINALEKGLAEGRKHGLRLLLGFSSVNQLFDSYGEKKARAMLSMCGTKVSLRVSEPDAAEWTARMLGEEEIFREQTSLSVGTNDNQSFSDHKEKNLLVSPTEIMNLPEFTAFLKLSGPYPVTEIHNEWRDRKIVAEPTVPREIPDHVDIQELEPEAPAAAQALERAMPKTRKTKQTPTASMLKIDNEPLI